ncbi:gem-associated protein 8-like [Bombus vosnesenskii]|uniref:Gem-associated protein 8-like n=3 Tax=Pyrobombus TaxID=144703 RepID=A0A6J3LBE1_9HYME|nr:gem-associated protein 8 [Bombus impatiens]XP_033203890.1 gem-associated protein 8-like [Bombus vancouverensis nearcticus]XP_033311964.1 gem-associated protein 8-like [Bombus bifarius]XP_033362495.1 gem-associated protein 8-like [Bombus vosnesenskii]
MEFVGVKRGRSRKKTRNLKKQRSQQIKFEVKFAKRRGLISDRNNIFVAKEKVIVNTMQANSFWENYTAAQEWQKRHSITWWRTRCIALEYENQILKDKLKSLVCQSGQQYTAHKRKKSGYKYQNGEEKCEETRFNEEAENLEFHIDEEMMSFLEQSMRHKFELKKLRESETCIKKRKEEEETIQGGATWMHARNSNAKLLYGEASPTILAMETALQTTVDRHRDKAKPQYWPIIPLKP